MLDINLIRAVKANKINALKALIDLYAEYGDEDHSSESSLSKLKEVDEKGRSLLHIAVKLGHKEIVEVLLENNLAVNLKDKAGKTALDIAFKRGDNTLLKLLSKKGGTLSFSEIDSNFTKQLLTLEPSTLSNLLVSNPNITEALSNIESIIEAEEDIFETLLGLNIGTLERLLVLNPELPKLTDEKGNTLLHLAVMAKDEEAIATLIARKADPELPNNEGISPFDLALKTNNQNIVSLLLATDESPKDLSGSSPSKDSLLSMEGALNSDDLNEIRKILKENPRLVRHKDSSGQTMLHKAVIKQNYELLKTLMAYSPDPFVLDSEGKSPLHYANENGFLKLFNALIATQPAGLMHYAVQNNLLYMVKSLLEYPFFLEQVDSDGATPFEKAINLPRIEILEMMIRSTALEEEYKELLVNNNSVLHIAAKKGWEKVAEHILESSKEQLNRQNSSLETPLHTAINEGNVEIVNILLQSNADRVTIVDSNNYTALKLALVKNDPNLIDLFINKQDINEKYVGHTLLYWVAKYGYTEIVQKLLDLEASVNWDSSKGNTPLHIAAEEGHKDVIKLLIEKGAEIDAVGVSNYSALHFAVLYKRYEAIKLLIDEGANVNFQDSKGYTPLHLAAKQGDEQSINLLLSSDVINVNIEDNDGFTALTLAANEGHIQSAESLIKFYKCKKAWKDDDGNMMPIEYVAAVEGWTNLIQACLNKKYDLNKGLEKSGETPLYLAASKGKTEVVKILINKVDINKSIKDGNAPLHAAVKYDYNDIAKLLVAKANINQPGHNKNTPLHYAVKYENIEAVRLLIRYKADYMLKNTDGITPLDKAFNIGNVDVFKAIDNDDLIRMYAAKTGDISLFKSRFSSPTTSFIESNLKDKFPMLLGEAWGVINFYPYMQNKIKYEMGANIYRGKHLIHFAAQNGKIEMLKYLIEYIKIDASKLSDIGKNALHYAVKGGNIETIKYLIEKGVSKKQADYYGNTPLHKAIHLGKAEVVELVYDKEIIDSKNKSGETPLIIAVEKENLSIVQKLIKEGANVNIKSDNIKPVLYVTVANNNVELVKELVENGKGDVNVQADHKRTPLFIAAAKGNIAMVEYLVNKGANIDYAGSIIDDNVQSVSALYIAVAKGYKDIVKFLVEKGANMNLKASDDTTALTRAVQFEEFDIADYLIEKGAGIEAKTIFEAIKQGRENLAVKLITKGGDISVKDAKGNTPLFIALEKNMKDLAKLIIEKGADFTLKNSEGDTVLHKAVKYNMLESLELMLKAKAPLEKDNAGNTPLHLAVKNNAVSMVKVLLDNGANVNDTNAAGLTPIKLAVNEKVINMTALLIKRGAKFENGDKEILENAFQELLTKNGKGDFLKSFEDQKFHFEKLNASQVKTLTETLSSFVPQDELKPFFEAIDPKVYESYCMGVGAES
ncbi:MAG: uncharacterized protein K0Q51_2 [Rickettsiaceae bacterium]|jgi:ankyrin repeat protein|nr:uncharacterized protein [Rickettsiaceae bacterium]